MRFYPGFTRYQHSTAATELRLTDCLSAFVFIANWGVRDVSPSSASANEVAPVMLVFADSNAIRLEHMVDFFQLLGGGQKDAGRRTVPKG